MSIHSEPLNGSLGALGLRSAALDFNCSRLLHPANNILMGVLRWQRIRECSRAKNRPSLLGISVIKKLFDQGFDKYFSMKKTNRLAEI